MLKFYYNPISVNARRVWVALLEKQIPFEAILLKLDGDQFESEFTAINPFQHIPVIVDDGFRVLESLAILDYLEAKYPSPSLMPKDAEAIAMVRMVQMIALNELQPATISLMKPMVQLDVEPAKLEAAQQRIVTVLQFYENLLGDKFYFAGEEFTLAEVVAGTLIPSLPLFGISLESYPQLEAWSERLSQRKSWQQTTASSKQIAAAIPHIKKILERRAP
jgi:glutathione S-transferase